METKHTPGPWALGGTYEDTLLGGNGERVYFVTSPFAGLNQKTENAVANTRLALSAPELLDALESIIKASPRQYEAALMKAYAVIAKATGREV